MIRMTLVNKITKMKVCIMDIKTKFGGKISFLTSIEKKGMKDRDKDAKSEGWNLGKFLLKFSNYPPNNPSQTLQA